MRVDHGVDEMHEAPDEERPAAHAEHIEGAVDASPEVRLRVVAGMGGELRREMHAMLGLAQLLRLSSGLDHRQSQWVDAIVSAGTRLLIKVQNVVRLTELGATPPDVLTDAQMDGLYAGATPEQAATGRAAPARALQVMVVDDSELNRDIAATFIQSAGHVATLCAGGDAAVTEAAAGDFDVVLMDVQMPGIDGLEACRRIRALPGAHGRVPVIALTAQTNGGQLEACREAGMNGHLAKPFRFDTLLEAITRMTSTPGTAANPAVAPSDRRQEYTQANGKSVQSDMRGTAESAQDSGAWIDIADPWNMADAHADGGTHAPQRSYIIDTQFDVKLTQVGQSRQRQLVDRQRTCAPPGDRDQYEFHWLLYTDPGSSQQDSFTATCDLWRWSGSTWRSISAAGAQFTPDEMYLHGWRYCGPCVEKTARVEVG